MMKDFSKAVNLFSLKDFDFHEVEGHEGGRNQIFICSKNGEKWFVLRISATGDRTEKDYLAETEFIRYLTPFIRNSDIQKSGVTAILSIMKNGGKRNELFKHYIKKVGVVNFVKKQYDVLILKVKDKK